MGLIWSSWLILNIDDPFTDIRLLTVMWLTWSFSDSYQDLYRSKRSFDTNCMIFCGALYKWSWIVSIRSFVEIVVFPNIFQSLDFVGIKSEFNRSNWITSVVSFKLFYFIEIIHIHIIYFYNLNFDWLLLKQFWHFWLPFFN